MRKAIATLIVPLMIVTGFRFSKDYRRGVSRFHRTVYACCDCVGANIKAGI